MRALTNNFSSLTVNLLSWNPNQEALAMRVDIGINRVLINNSKIWKLGAKAISVEDFTFIA